MKERMIALLLGGMIASGALAQKPTAVINKASVSPVIDGLVDPVWAEANAENNIDKSDEDEFPTLGEPGETTWQGLWDWDGIYILLRVTDDDFYPNYEAGPEEVRWEYDSPEIYFDVNYFLEDGIGPMVGDGHYQFAPEFSPSRIDGTAFTETNGFKHAFRVDDPNYTAEYFIPLSVLMDEDGYEVDLEREVGFDISIIDRDMGDDSSRVAVWSNIGTVDGSWANMDDCGIITFDEAEIYEYVEEINLTGGEITENNGKLRILAEVLPQTASNKKLEWTIENTSGKASIDQDGVVTAKIDGEVAVTATAVDGSYIEKTAYVTISNQIVSIKDVNVIQNPDFEEVEADGTAVAWDDDAIVQYGYAICTPGEPEDPPVIWSSQFNQSGLAAEPDIAYRYSFVAWADEARSITTNFEDPANEYSRYGYSEDPRTSWGGNESDWTFEITDEPARYTFDVVFTLEPNTIQKVGFQLGASAVTTYLDSFQLVSLNDLSEIEDYIPVSDIIVSGAEGATTVALGGTLALSAEVFPAEADYQDVKWSVVPESGYGTINEAGVLTGDSSGTVTVVATAVDDSYTAGELKVFVSFPEAISQRSVNTLKVYPNPADSELNVVLSMENRTVAIYNSVGVKLDEVVVSGTGHRFAIGSYPPGIYYVRSDNAVSRFVK